MGAAAENPPEVWFVRGEGGDVIPMQLPLGEGIAARLRSGACVRVNEDGSPWTDQPAVEAAAPASSLAEQLVDREREEELRNTPQVPLPDRAARKPAWVDYAVRQGMTRSAAEDLTKDELIARYGG